MAQQRLNKHTGAEQGTPAAGWSAVALWTAHALPGASYAQLPEAMLAAIANDGRLRELSKKTYSYALKDFWRWKGERIFSRSTIEQYVAFMVQHGHAVPTVNKALAAVRWLANYLSMLALDDAGLPEAQREALAHQCERVALVKNLRNLNTEALAGRHVKLGEFDRLMDACIEDKGPAGARDGAMLMMAWGTGMRMGELAALTMASIKRPDGEGYVNIEIIGKGGKHRTNYMALEEGVAHALADWLDVRGDAEGALFNPINKGGTVALRHMSRQALQQTLQQRVADAGLRAATTWHDFRRTFIGNRWSDKWDAATLSKYVGHASSSQTVRYDRRPEDVRRAAALALAFDYAGRNN